MLDKYLFNKCTVGWRDRQKNELQVPSSVGGGVEFGLVWGRRCGLEAKEGEKGYKAP